MNGTFFWSGVKTGVGLGFVIGLIVGCGAMLILLRGGDG